jgi:hypothetical protein
MDFTVLGTKVSTVNTNLDRYLDFSVLLWSSELKKESLNGPLYFLTFWGDLQLEKKLNKFFLIFQFRQHFNGSSALWPGGIRQIRIRSFGGSQFSVSHLSMQNIHPFTHLQKGKMRWTNRQTDIYS